MSEAHNQLQKLIFKLQNFYAPLLIGVATALHVAPRDKKKKKKKKKNGPLLLEEFVLQVTEHNGDLFWHLTLEPRDLL